MTVRSYNRAVAWALVALGLTALVGCRAEEQGRPLTHEKGVYLGPADDPIDDATREKLKERARKQAF